ncbi:MAG TPA: hypothetical protein VKY19_22550 [Ktedonosporobacter sp.]|nr:hypothetical protein [Ktedonosporobacter sp.]
MAGFWDTKLKQLMLQAPKDVVSWLLDGALFEQELSPHLSYRNVDADLLYQIRLNDQPMLLHLEFQRRRDPQMAQRVWEYNVLATCKFGCPVYSFVLYLKKDGSVAESPHQVCLHDGRQIHHFVFEVIKLWEVPTATLQRTDLPGLLPLLPLTREGKQRETIEMMINGLCPAGEAPKRELLSIAYGLASLVLEEHEEEYEWLKRRFLMIEDLLGESRVFQEWRQQALEEGLQQGMQKERKEEVQRHREMLLAFVHARFPALEQLAEERGKALDDPEHLQALILSVGLAAGEQEAKKFLSNGQ